jgi:hypothetical protein
VITLACPGNNGTCLNILQAYGDATPDADMQVTIPFTRFDRSSQRHIRENHPEFLPKYKVNPTNGSPPPVPPTEDGGELPTHKG